MSTSIDLSNNGGFVCVPVALASKLKHGLTNEIANPTPGEAAWVAKLNEAIDQQTKRLKEEARELVISIEENNKAEAEAKEFLTECHERRQRLEKITREIKELEAKPAPAKPVIGAKKQSTKKTDAAKQLCLNLVDDQCNDPDCKLNHNMALVGSNNDDGTVEVVARESWPRDTCMFNCNNNACERKHYEEQEEEQNGSLAFELANAKGWFFPNACKYGTKCYKNPDGECPFNHNPGAKERRH